MRIADTELEELRNLQATENGLATDLILLERRKLEILRQDQKNVTAKAAFLSKLATDYKINGPFDINLDNGNIEIP